MSPAKPRIWPTLVFGAFFVPITWSVTKLLWSVLRSSDLLPDGVWSDSTTAFIVQGLIFEVVCLGALFYVLRRHREPLRSSLSLGRGRLSLWWMPIVYFGCLGAALLGGLLNLVATGSQSPRVQDIDSQIRAASGGELFAVLILTTVMAALSEELIFRGFIQTRLLRRLSPWWAILLSSLFFAMVHGDIAYIIAVLPIGLWLGYVAYLAESIWPSMVCHALHNFLVFLAALGGSDPPKGATPEHAFDGGDPDASLIQLFIATLAGLLVWWMSRILSNHRRPRAAALSSRDEAR